MRKMKKITFLVLLATLMISLFTACGKKKENKNEESPTEAAASRPMKSYRHGTMPISLEIPEEAETRETEGDVCIETSDSLLYIFGMDTYGGGVVFGEKDIVSLMDSQQGAERVKAMLHLKNFTVTQNSEPKYYSNINGVNGFWCRLSDMAFEGDGVKCNGNGFVMLYRMQKGVGVYGVLGILKNTDASREAEVLNVMNTCALSLRQLGEDAGEYEVIDDTMPDGVAVKAAYRKDSITEVEKLNDGICLFLNEEGTEYFLVKHYNASTVSSSEEFLQSILNDIRKEEGVTTSDIEFVRGKMEYRRITMTYDRDGQEMQEVICASVNDEGSLWIVDLYGTTENVALQQDNLATLLWSLTEG